MIFVYENFISFLLKAFLLNFDVFVTIDGFIDVTLLNRALNQWLGILPDSSVDYLLVV